MTNKYFQERKAKFMHNVQITDKCWNWLGKKVTKGYGIFEFKGLGNRSHRISYQIFKGPIVNNLHVCHTCDNPPCVNPDHLWLGTNKENHEDCRRKGRWKPNFGKKNGRTIISSDTIDNIKNINRLAGIHYKALAKFFHISPSYAHKIIKLKTRVTEAA